MRRNKDPTKVKSLNEKNIEIFKDFFMLNKRAPLRRSFNLKNVQKKLNEPVHNIFK